VVLVVLVVRGGIGGVGGRRWYWLSKFAAGVRLVDIQIVELRWSGALPPPHGEGGSPSFSRSSNIRNRPPPFRNRPGSQNCKIGVGTFLCNKPMRDPTHTPSNGPKWCGPKGRGARAGEGVLQAAELAHGAVIRQLTWRCMGASRRAVTR